MDVSANLNSTFLEALLEGTPDFIATDLRTIKTVLRQHLNADKQSPDYDVFSCMPPLTVEELVENPRFYGGFSGRIFYNADVRKLILKLPERPHEVATRGIELLVSSEAVRQRVKRELTITGTETVRATPYAKEGDTALVPRRDIPGRDNNKWPTIVIETELSESPTAA